MSTHSPDTHWTPLPADHRGAAPRCVSCGNQVTKQFSRVFGDNQDIVHACPECSTYREMKTSDFIPESHR